MKTKDLIKQLQEADPSGEAIVYSYDGDICAAVKLPWYYDGKPGVRILGDEDHIIGYQEIDDTFVNGKVYLYGFGDFEAGERWAENDAFIVKGSDRFMDKVLKQKQINQDILDKHESTRNKDT